MSLNLPHSEAIQFLLDRARRMLGPHRMLHVLGVTHTAMALAARHRLDVAQAALVGLLHDQSKEIPPQEIRAELEAMGYPLPAEDLEYPHTWHGYHAAALGRIELGLCQPEIIEAVSLHTTGDAEIGPLTKVIFIADLCEPGRSPAFAPEILRQARRDLDEAFRRALVHKLLHVLGKKKALLHPKALRALRAHAHLRPEQLEELAAGDAPLETYGGGSAITK
jgi:predicted HD superfamily hydrolase involved in NAD metabolism